jgi:hypothetical protein
MGLFALRYLILAVVLAVLTLLICLLIYNSHSPWRSDAETVYLWLYPYVAGAVPTLVVLMPLVTLGRVWKIRRTPSISGERRYTFSDEGIKVEFGMATSELKWSFYTRIKETADFFLLFVTGSFCSIIPKRCFADTVQLDSFRSLIRVHAQKYSLKK